MGGLGGTLSPPTCDWSSIPWADISCGRLSLLGPPVLGPLSGSPGLLAPLLCPSWGLLRGAGFRHTCLDTPHPCPASQRSFSGGLTGTHVCYALRSPKLLGDFYGLPFLHRVLVVGRRTVTSQGPTLTTHSQAPVLTLGKLSTLP